MSFKVRGLTGEAEHTFQWGGSSSINDHVTQDQLNTGVTAGNVLAGDVLVPMLLTRTA